MLRLSLFAMLCQLALCLFPLILCAGQFAFGCVYLIVKRDDLGLILGVCRTAGDSPRLQKQNIVKLCVKLRRTLLQKVNVCGCLCENVAHTVKFCLMLCNLCRLSCLFLGLPLLFLA